MSRRILLIGDGGHCKAVLDSLFELGQYSEIGIVGKREQINHLVLGVPVIACDDDLPKLLQEGFTDAFVAVGSIGDPQLRIRLYQHLDSIGFAIPNIIDPSARVSQFAELAQGIFIGKHASINANAKIGRGAIINTGAIIEHDCLIGEFVHISPGAVLGGGVKIGNHSHIGLNATIKQQIQIGSGVIVGMGSVVTKDFGDAVLAYGNPCRKVRDR